jgi:hypothetical protein
MNLEYIRNLSRLGIEVWKDIPKFEGFYQVSNLGNVISLNYRKSKKKRILKKHKRVDGRKFVHLCKNGVRYSNKVISVLVAMAFLNHKPCGYKLVVDHQDNNPLNDRLYNLQVITHRQNISKDKKGFSKYTAYKKSLKEYETKEIYYDTKNKKTREYSKPNLYECRGNKTKA